MTLDALSVKYRPQKLADIIGQKVSVQALTNSFKSNNWHHAYILAGMMGSGKTSAARIMAAMDNCEKGRTLEPCGECENCKEIFAGKSIDVLEIDAASNGGIDNIRSLKEDAKFSPTKCKIRYFIIDECQSLSSAAAEASLKLIEEPPSGVRFILATTHPQLLKDTIHSRCQFLKFNKVSDPDLFAHIVDISKRENIIYDEEALKIAVKSANGSVRDALQNLQSIVSYVGKDVKLTAQAAQEILGVVNNQLYFDLIEGIVKTNAFKCFQIISSILKDGREAKIVIDDIDNHLRNLRIVITCSKHIESFGFLEDELKRLQHQCSYLTESKGKIALLLEWSNLLQKTNEGLILNRSPQNLLEQYVLEAIIAKRKIESDNIIN